MHLPGPQWKSSVSQLPCKSAYVKKTNSHIGMKIMCNYQCPRPILLLQVYCVRACKPCDVWSSLLIGRHRHTSPSFAVLERLRDFPDLLPAHSRRACNENKNKMNSMSHPLCRCSTRRFCLEVKTWTRDLQWAQMFRVVSPPLGLDCLWRMTKWGGEQKHKTLDSFCSDLCSDATSGACCILYIARSPWARHFETPKPNPDAEVQAITARSWPFMWEPSAWNKLGLRYLLYNLRKPAAAHMFTYETAENRQRSRRPASNCSQPITVYHNEWQLHRRPTVQPRMRDDVVYSMQVRKWGKNKVACSTDRNAYINTYSSRRDPDHSLASLHGNNLPSSLFENLFPVV